MDSLYLPEELVILILEQLPPAASVRFKSLCKSWLRILSAPGFLERRILLRSKRQEKLLAITRDIKSYYAIILESPTSPTPTKFSAFPILPNKCISYVEGSCRGIVCLADTLSGKHILWNPTTGQSRLLPDHRPEVCRWGNPYSYMVGFNEYDGDLKVVKILPDEIYNSERPKHFRYQALLYELSSNSWREISPIGIDTRKLISNYYRSPNGNNCSWMALSWDSKNNEFVQSSIVSFNMATEAFTTFSSPMDTPINDKHYLYLLMLNGFLAWTCCQFEDEKQETSIMEIWILLQPGIAESWTKLWTIRFPSLELHRPMEFWNGGLVIKRRTEVGIHLIWHDLSNPQGAIHALSIASKPGQRILAAVVPFERNHASVAAVSFFQ